jgi:hypothetical protein
VTYNTQSVDKDIEYQSTADWIKWTNQQASLLYHPVSIPRSRSKLAVASGLVYMSASSMSVGTLVTRMVSESMLLNQQ